MSFMSTSYNIKTWFTQQCINNQNPIIQCLLYIVYCVGSNRKLKGKQLVPLRLGRWGGKNIMINIWLYLLIAMDYVYFSFCFIQVLQTISYFLSYVWLMKINHVQRATCLSWHRSKTNYGNTLKDVFCMMILLYFTKYIYS